MTILVTGGGGFLGLAIVRALLRRGEEVRTFSRGEHRELRALPADIRRGDVGCRAEVFDAVRGCETVYHVAAKAGVWGPAREYEHTNVTGTDNVIAACAASGVRRLVFTSSPSVVFAGNDEAGIDEAHPYPERFLAHYPRTKAIAERRVRAAGNPSAGDLTTISLRPHLIWGPGDPHLVPRIITRARSGRLRLIGKRANRIDSTFVDNAAAAHLLAADALANNPALSGNVYFISNDEPVPVASLVNGILAAAGMDPVHRYLPAGLAYGLGAALEGTHWLLRRTDEPLMTRFVARQLSTEHWFDLSAARRDLRYRPEVSLTEGLAHLRTWLESSGPGAEGPR